ncbi:hypothetical protein B4P00_21260 [Shewanella xiamenensis]|jgi:hypothetical protein|uniref:hypothetical protein n=1 Tax=Shewanella xiamenensis TaxID=332186 RepID=UPI001C4E18B6|nr:hypothetical protein [Shewanella xiamenensis]MBW0298702.1 hypothetical protein [Shewanella xiamenensis]
MKIDTSKLANKSDLIVLIALIAMIVILGLIIYLATINTFIAGFISAMLTWNWKRWFYDPVDRFLERHWPFRD